MGEAAQNLIFFAVTAVITVCAPAIMLFASATPQVGEVALIIAPPWGDSAAQIAKRSNVAEVTPERAPFGALVMLETPQSADQLFRQGAWLVMDGRKVLELCSK
ncbi:MAG: hypothetical protein ACPGSW_04225 [Phaeobacter italicus]|jgi:hypothetical protein|uniref:Uncharacterized protein n=1 Tax=Phaeobacter italicus TaxID=481446 RepID=A0A0H5D5G0_9RHOB|nr:hypothetical protein [Phaeobacter italicus]MBY6044232.1 hypothetical protein [Phaeobacter italicus]MEE2818090.1 hypothetical protein [Pseudomonadota bacterium]GLO73097.1 hypothetical protein MACH18_01770 [Phaeobacter italicus]CRL12336.1 hypothetical protein NIT7321_03210 [Phaeobacter italicus]